MEYTLEEITASKESFDKFVELNGDIILKSLYENKYILGLLLEKMVESY